MMRHVVLATTLLLAAPSSFAAAMGRRIEVRASIDVLGDIEFEGQTPTLTKDSERELDKVARTLEENPSLCILVQSAQDPGLTHLQAQWRAAAVRAYFYVHGIDDARLTTRVVAPHPGAAIELVLE